MSEIERDSLFPSTREGIAELLKYDTKRLYYLLFHLPEDKRYTTFSLPKKNGELRTIMTPVSAIKTIQRRLSDYLYTVYRAKTCIHGFVRGRDVVSNASFHVHKRWVVNIDLKDFFSTINFGRVRGAFLSQPFNCSEESATLLAQICCYNNKLPQGAPTSPIVSNIICHQLDNRMIDFARKNKLFYTRYADDITLSTNLKIVPKSLGTLSDDGSFLLGEAIIETIVSCGFTINKTKVHCNSRNGRQTVTGLVTNEKTNVPRRYIKQIRCMLHAYEKYGLKQAAREHFEKYTTRKTQYPELTFRKILIGKIGYLGHVKGKQDSIYKNFVSRMKQQDPSIPLSIPLFTGEERIIVYGEGKTDALHLQAAYKALVNNGKHTDLSINFYRYRDEDDVNNETLFKLCSTRNIQKENDKIEIYLFDRDVPHYINKASNPDGSPRSWGHNIYSMILPKVDHRSFDEICIEHYYQDDDLLKTDDKGRRIYLSSEFDKQTGQHLKEDLMYSKPNYLKSPHPRILDSGVIDSEGNNVALSKMAFANNVLRQKGNYQEMDFSAFAAIFDEIKRITENNTSL